MFIFLLKSISPMWHELMKSSSQHKLYFPADENIQPPPLLKSVLIMRVEESEMPSEMAKRVLQKERAEIKQKVFLNRESKEMFGVYLAS